MALKMLFLKEIVRGNIMYIKKKKPASGGKQTSNEVELNKLTQHPTKQKLFLLSFKASFFNKKNKKDQNRYSEL